LNVLATEVQPAAPPPVTKWLPADPVYQASTALGLFYKFYATQYAKYTSLPSNITSITQQYVRPLSKGAQVFTPSTAQAPLGQPVPKIEGLFCCVSQHDVHVTVCDILSLSNRIHSSHW
jgi:hypothetical protein